MEFYTAQDYIDAHFKPGQDHETEYPRLYAEWKAYKKLLDRQLLKAEKLLQLAGVTPSPSQATRSPSSRSSYSTRSSEMDVIDLDCQGRDRWWGIRHRLCTVQGGKCFWCCRELGEHWQVDHHIPRALGGSQSIENLRALCISCNQRKGRLMPEEFAIIMTHDLL